MKGAKYISIDYPDGISTNLTPKEARSIVNRLQNPALEPGERHPVYGGEFEAWEEEPNDDASIKTEWLAFLKEHAGEYLTHEGSRTKLSLPLLHPLFSLIAKIPEDLDATPQHIRDLMNQYRATYITKGNQ